MDRVVEVTSFHKDPRAAAIVMEVAREWFDPERRAAWTAVGVTGLWNPGYLHEIYALAVLERRVSRLRAVGRVGARGRGPCDRRPVAQRGRPPG